MLLDKIIELATDNQQPLTVLLRQCIVLAYELKNEQLKIWANAELNGYSDRDKVPEYRIVSTGVTGLFVGPGWARYEQGIPSVALEEKHRKWAEIVEIAESVGALEHMLTSGKGSSQIQFGWNSNLVLFYRERLNPGWQLFSAHQDVPKSAVAGLLDTIRTRVLNLALELKNEIGESDADLKKVKGNSAEAEKVGHIVQAQIFGGTVYIATGQQNVSVQNIEVGNWADLKKALNESGIDEKDVAELSQALQKDGKTLGTGVKAWISRNAEKVIDHGLQVGTSVGTAILTQYIKSHLGLP
jgi:AbiTii